MNKNLAVMSLNALNERLNTAKENLRKCSSQVAEAKQTFTATPDTPNLQALSSAKLAFLGASGVVRKAEEAVRVFCYKQKPSLTGTGKVLRR
jgi:hypothetical protein